MQQNSFLETESLEKLMKKYAVPCVISLLVGALYNIVDQIFIANASYLGSYGNAANTVVFPLTVIALAIAVMIGDGCSTFVSMSLGAGKTENAKKSVGCSIVLTVISSLLLTAVYLFFAEQIVEIGMGGFVSVAHSGVFQVQHPARAERVHHLVFRVSPFGMSEDFTNYFAAFLEDDCKIQFILCTPLYLAPCCL